MAVALLVGLFLEPSQLGPEFWTVLLALAILSATQDIAIDAYTIGLLDKSELGPGNGARETAYRISLIVAGGLLVALAGIIGWAWCLGGAAVLLGLLAVLCSRSPQETSRANVAGRPRTLRDAVMVPCRDFLGTPGVLAVALFILTFKLGDLALGPMIKPFWVDQAFTPVEIGLVPGTIGVVSTIAGALWGGRLTAQWGIFRALWVTGIFQAGSNLAYVAAANWPAASMMYSASVVESFCGGLGTAPFLAFLMSLCSPAHAATQYALLSALFGLTRVVAGAFSGVGAEQFGYATYFALTCVLALPAFGLLPWVRAWAEGKVSSTDR
jgi:PAT family beta-lactamase induction signal transducer AmpG